MKIILLQLFWLSFSVIGFAELLIYKKFHKPKQNPLIKFLSNTHPLMAALILWAMGATTFAVIIVPGCFIHWPISVLQTTYCAALLFSIITLVKTRSCWVVLLKNRLVFNRQTTLPLIVIGVILAVDFWTALNIGGRLDGDAQFELAQINLFAQQHLTLANPIHGDSGVPMTVYSTNLQHALQALVSKLLDTSAAWVWFYSHAFFRLLMWLGLFGLSWELIDKKVQRNWSYVVLGLLPFLSGALLMDIELHHKVVLIWITIFLLGLKLWLEKGNAFILIVGAVLISTSHPLNSLMAASFMGLVALALLATRSLTSNRLVHLIGIIVLLLLAQVPYFYYPHEISPSGFIDSPSSGPTINLKSFGPLFFNWVRLPFNWLAFIVYGVAAGCLFLVWRLKNTKLQLPIFLLAVISTLLVYSPHLLSLIGYGYLIIKIKNNLVRASLTLLVLFAALIIYNPVIVTLAHNQVPLWVLSRFHDFNVLAYVAPTIGLLCVMTLPLSGRKYKDRQPLLIVSTFLISIIVVPVLYPIDITTAFSSDHYQSRKQRLDELETIKTFNYHLEGQVVFSDDPELALMIPTVIVANLFMVDNEANAHPAIHINERKQCAAKLRQNLKITDIQAASITRVITGPRSDKSFIELANASLPLLIARGDYRVYTVIKPTHPINTGICVIPPTKK